MILEAELNTIHATVNGLFSHAGILVPFGITLLLDTGASCSCLLPDHVYYFGIPYKTLHNASDSTNTASGEVIPKILPRVTIFLPLREAAGEPIQIRGIHFEEFQVLSPPRRFQPQPRHRIVSILGMDVLQNFTNWKWDWNSRKLVLSD